MDYTHKHAIYGNLKFQSMSEHKGYAYFIKDNGQLTLLLIKEVEVYKPNVYNTNALVASAPIQCPEPGQARSC